MSECTVITDRESGGEARTAARRAYVNRSVKDEFVSLLTRRFGGVKQSAIGRDGGKAGMLEFQEIR